MTIICYKDGTLASDSAVDLCGVMSLSVCKIAKSPDGSVGGASGCGSDCEQFLDWLRQDRPAKHDMRVRPEDDEDAMCAFYVLPNGWIGVVYNALEQGVHEGPWYAEGTNNTFAMGAMAAGASAEEAVRLTIQHCKGCGGEIQTLRLGKDA